MTATGKGKRPLRDQVHRLVDTFAKFSDQPGDDRAHVPPQGLRCAAR